tara:strand:- start:9010 stop:9510 length:501 start_codon:yes stop_codon:yes gene_type:complete
MNKNMFYLIVCFLTISICAQSQSFNYQFANSQSKAYALLDLGFSAKLLHLNTEGANTVVKKEEVKKSPRSLEEILAKSKNKNAEEITNVVNATKYHLVVGCFSNINNAQRLVSKLNDQGHSSKIIVQNNRGLHMVAFDSYVSISDARRDQKVLSTEGVCTWIKSNK